MVAGGGPASRNSTVWKVLPPRLEFTARHGGPRAGQQIRVALPGDLLHMDTSRHARFSALATRLPAIDPRPGVERYETGVGYDYAHAIVATNPGSPIVEISQRREAGTVPASSNAPLTTSPSHGITAKTDDDRQRA